MSAAANPQRIVPRLQAASKAAAPGAVASIRPSVAPKSAATVPIKGARPALVEVNGGRAATVAPQAAAPTSAQKADPISHFIDLEVEARRCGDLDSLRLAIVNSTRKLANFDQAFLAEPGIGGRWTITRASSVATVDRNSALIRTLEAWIGQSDPATKGRKHATDTPRLANLSQEASGSADTSPATSPATSPGASNRSLPFPFVLWLPIKARDGRVLSALIALKRENWRPQHSALLLPLADAYGHAWDALVPQSAATGARLRGYVTKSRLAIILGVLALAAAFVPVPMSALAPAEIAAAEPMLVTAPIDGVIGDVLVAPGQWVDKGTPLIRFVDVKLRNELEVAKRNKAVAEARHFKVLQSAVATQKDMQEIGTTKAELDVAVAELQFAEDLLARSVVRAERSGLLIYAAKSDWVGKPVVVGERMMEIGDPANTEIKIDIPVSDAVAIRRDGQVSLFLDGDPLNTVEGRVHRVSYRPALTADQQMAFRVVAKFADGQPRRIGLRGVARVNSENVSLWFYLFRRPIASIRQRIGL